MERSGYSDDEFDSWAVICWRGAVASAIRGARGQALLRELLTDLDAMETKELAANVFEENGGRCALGVIGAQRGVDLTSFDPEWCDYKKLAETFGVAQALVREIMYINDDAGPLKETPAERWQRMRSWTEKQLASASVQVDAV